MKARLPREYQPKSQAELIRQAQQMQENMATLQEDLDNREYTATAGGNMVEVTVTGAHQLKSIKVLLQPLLLLQTMDTSSKTGQAMVLL